MKGIKGLLYANGGTFKDRILKLSQEKYPK